MIGRSYCASSLSRIIIGLSFSLLLSFASTVNSFTMSASSTSNKNKVPNLPIPEPILSTEPGTWAHDTMSRRVDAEILQRTWEDNQEVWESSPEKFSGIIQRFEDLRNELRSASTSKLTYLDEDIHSDDEERIREWKEWRDYYDRTSKREIVGCRRPGWSPSFMSTDG